MFERLFLLLLVIIAFSACNESTTKNNDDPLGGMPYTASFTVNIVRIDIENPDTLKGSFSFSVYYSIGDLSRSSYYTYNVNFNFKDLLFPFNSSIWHYTNEFYKESSGTYNGAFSKQTMYGNGYVREILSFEIKIKEKTVKGEFMIIENDMEKAYYFSGL